MNLYRKLAFALAFVLCGFTLASGQGVKVTTVSPDIKVRVLKCEATGNTVLVTLTLENTTSRDMNFSLCGGYDNHSVAIDDEGNKYTNHQIHVKIGNDYYNSLFVMGDLYSEVPLKVTYKITDVPESATSFSRLNLWFNSNDRGIYDQHIKISNLPISRDGDY